ncbi:hypothetical protein JW710_00755 [Candidatus Dojkabacteria bacterium]|nr:hypothetical protein [Candidatus Dojkabacteria bacterium]
MKKILNILVLVFCLTLVVIPVNAQESGEEDLQEEDLNTEKSDTVDSQNDADTVDAEEDLDSEDTQQEGDSEEKVETFFEVESEIGTQSVITGEIPIYLYLRPKIDSSKAQLEWSVPRGLEAGSSTEVWFEMKEDEGRTFVLYVKPEESGKYKVTVNVTAWRYDTTYFDSADVEFEVDDNLLVTPQSAEYKRNKMFLAVGLVLGVLVVLSGSFFLIKFLIGKFKQWMAED